MLFDPEKKTIIDTSEIVPAVDPAIARRKCTDRMNVRIKQGEVMELEGVQRLKSGKSYRCIYRVETDEDL